MPEALLEQLSFGPVIVMGALVSPAVLHVVSQDVLEERGVLALDQARQYSLPAFLAAPTSARLALCSSMATVFKSPLRLRWSCPSVQTHRIHHLRFRWNTPRAFGPLAITRSIAEGWGPPRWNEAPFWEPRAY